MRNSFKMTVSGITLSLGVGLAGCGTESIPAPVNPPEVASAQTVDASIEHSLARLRALQLVDANRLVSDLPGEAYACYGIPCPGSKWVDAVKEERAQLAPKREKLVSIAENQMHNAYLYPRPMDQAPAAIEALASLHVVQVDRLIEVQPKQSGNCYGLVCPADKAAADQENGMRIARVIATVDEAKHSGL